MSWVILAGWIGLASAQQIGNLSAEIHPSLQWSRCAADKSCQQIGGEITLDANWRWLHQVEGYKSCYSGNTWDETVCNSETNCTTTCALEGAGSEYRQVYGIKTDSSSISLQLKTNIDFSYNIGSRLYLMESKTRYQTFTLLNNELAYDVDLSTVECGINAALKFVAMDVDGGQAKYPTNKAGAEYGTGYCDATCSRAQRFVGGRANMFAWIPSEHDPFAGEGPYGACCPEFAVWNSNAHSYSMSTHACVNDHYYICQGRDECDFYSGAMRYFNCDLWGCNYNPYRLGAKDFYGRGKKVDTSRKFTVVTRFSETQVAQFFIQDSKRIDLPSSPTSGLVTQDGLTAEICKKMPVVFDERDAFAEIGGWEKHKKLLSQPMVLSMSITDDHYYYNTWLDSQFPLQDAGIHKGVDRGDCYWEDSNPVAVEARYGNAKVVWSNIRFGPIGSTVDI
ncbi:cellulose 1,4-beta-cellobiosidase [Lasiosphaeris hirsuta]|uniref:Glucanase n=1 Tax=Lasiosphaeris hirsuta TaxID=260670 RepID=A0AA40B1W2_9PEZI|nr:cellulose 1,4-beta-cellobiosidase [Lasiosphaeris hirsuta]